MGAISVGIVVIRSVSDRSCNVEQGFRDLGALERVRKGFNR